MLKSGVGSRFLRYVDVCYSYCNSSYACSFSLFFPLLAPRFTSSKLVALIATGCQRLPLLSIGCQSLPVVAIAFHWFPTNEFFGESSEMPHRKETIDSEKKAITTHGNQWKAMTILATYGDQWKATVTKETNFDEVPLELAISLSTREFVATTILLLYSLSLAS